MSRVQVFVLLVVWLACAARRTAGQGLVPSIVPRLGASNTLDQLQQQYRNSQAWKRAYKLKPKSACGRGGGASLCAAQSTSAADAYAQLVLATSPSTYSSNSSSRPRLVSPAQDQAGCQTCTAFAVAAAAEMAMAAALQVDVQHCSISVQALFFCAPGAPIRSCDAGWNLREALHQLQQRGHNLPMSSCLPYKPDMSGDLSAAELCKGSCSSPSAYAGRGQFTSQQITSLWRAQKHIREYGAVVSRFDVYSDFKSFFADKRNAQAVYRPSAGAHPIYYHAIILVGYSNEHQYWLAKNSWGSSWGDNGLFKVAFGVCTVMAADKGEAFGISWTPSSKLSALQLPVAPGPRSDCYWYKARPGDYLSRIAWLAGIPLEPFMLDNTDQVKDLDASLQGLQLLLCKPKPDSVTGCAINCRCPTRQSCDYESGKSGLCRWYDSSCHTCGPNEAVVGGACACVAGYFRDRTDECACNVVGADLDYFDLISGQPVADVAACCQLCKSIKGCLSYVFKPNARCGDGQNICNIKSVSGPYCTATGGLANPRCLCASPDYVFGTLACC